MTRQQLRATNEGVMQAAGALRSALEEYCKERHIRTDSLTGKSIADMSISELTKVSKVLSAATD